MNRDQCRTVALNLLESVGEGLDDAENVESLLTLLIDVTRASAYATLASTELTPMPKPDPRVCGCSFLPDPHIEGASCPPVGPPRAERVLPPGYIPQYQGTRSVTPDPFKHPCECLGAPNGRHERGVFVGCIWARHLSDGPGQ